MQLQYKRLPYNECGVLCFYVICLAFSGISCLYIQYKKKEKNIWQILTKIRSCPFSSTTLTFPALNSSYSGCGYISPGKPLYLKPKTFFCQMFSKLHLCASFPYSHPQVKKKGQSTSHYTTRRNHWYFFSSPLTTISCFLLPPVPSDLLTFILLPPAFSTSFFFSEIFPKISFCFLRSEGKIIQGLEESRLALFDCTLQFYLITFIRIP